MKKRLFGDNIKPACKICLHGSPTEGDKIDCPKFGVVNSYSSCKKFTYSPLKRIPSKEIKIVHSDANQVVF